MNIRNRWVLALALCAAATAAEAATIVTLGSGFNSPAGVAVDGRGNVFVADADNNAVKEILAPGYTTVNTLGGGFSRPIGVAVDGNGNVFVADYDNNAVKEILAPGYTTVNTLGSGFNQPFGVAVDGSGNVFVADYGHNAVKEILAPGYTTVNTLASGFNHPTGVAVDGSGNVFVADAGNNAVKEILAPIRLSTSCMTTFVGNQPFTMLATVIGTTPTGSVTFNNGATMLCNSVVLSSASASCTVSTLAVTGLDTQDSYGLTATYSGDSNNPPAVSTPLRVNVLNVSDVVFRNDFELPAPGTCPTH